MKDIYSFFTYKVSIYPLLIEKFTDPNLFYEMLFDIFDFTAEDKNSLNHVFNVCNGYPGELKNLLSKIYFKNMNILCSQLGKIKWDSSLISKIIYEEQLSTKFENPIIKLIFLIILFLEIDLTYDLLISIAKFVFQKMHFVPVDAMEIEENIQQLLYNYKVIEVDYQHNENIVLNKSIIKKAYYNEFIHDSFMPMLSKYLCEYLLSNREILLQTLDKNMFFSQLAWHAYNSKYNNWENINFNIGKYFYDKSQVSHAFEIFTRIRGYWQKLNIDEKFVIISCMYEYGKYDYAMDVLKDIDLKSCSYKQLLLVVQVNSIDMRKKEAVKILDYMLKRFSTNLEKWEILDLKQRILSNIEGSRKDAKGIFDSMMKSYFQDNIKIYDNFLISSMEYYRVRIVATTPETQYLCGFPEFIFAPGTRKVHGGYTKNLTQRRLNGRRPPRVSSGTGANRSPRSSLRFRAPDAR